MLIASLTTIPPRIQDECKLTIDSLMNQVDIIYLCVCEAYERFGPMNIPNYLSQEPYITRVKVIVGADHGSATKYLGAIQHIKNQNQDAWVFVCDDDQEYHPDLVKRMCDVATKKSCVYQNRYDIFQQYGTQGGFIHGYVGLFIHSSMLCKLETFPLPLIAKHIDDQWMSVFCFLHNIEIYSTNINEYSDIYKVLNGLYEKIGKEPLESIGGRDERIQKLERYFSIKFHNVTVMHDSKNVHHDHTH